MSEHEADGARSRGLFDSLKDLLATVTALAHTRLELLGTELEEQVARLAILLVWSIVALFLVFTAVVLAAVALIVLFWDEHRVLAAFGLAGGMALLAGGSILHVVNQLRQRPRMFQATLEELAKDRQKLGGE
jgi:uncharacterized membrane protein YqjE